VMDHDYQRECCRVLKDNTTDAETKLSYAQSFVDALLHHSVAESKAVYAPLKGKVPFHHHIVESEVDHRIIKSRVQILIPKIQEELDDEATIELKVLAKFIEGHLKIEERDLFTLMRKLLDDEILNAMGYEFFKLRNFTEKDLNGHPQLQEELKKIEGVPQKVSSKFLRNIELKIHHQTA
jgi:hemerythrin-like domain-containing protein